MSNRRHHSRRHRQIHAGTAAFSVFVVACLAFVTWGMIHFYSGHAPSSAQPSSTTPTVSATASAATQQDEAEIASLWIGDSYTAGLGASNAGLAESCLTANRLGWVCTRDAESGTGFLADGHNMSPTYLPLPKRLGHDRAAYVPNVVVLDAGRNDAVFPAARVVQTARAYIAGVRAAFPHAKLVLVEPYFMNTTKPLIPALDHLYRAEAKQPSTYLIDPVGEGWIGAGTASMTIADHKHPDDAGYAYIAEHLATDLSHLGVTKG